MASSHTAWLLALAVLSSSCGQAAIEPFDLSDVQLANQTVQARAAELNTQYLFLLDTDRLLWAFRNNAGLATPSSPYQVRSVRACHTSSSTITQRALLWFV